MALEEYRQKRDFRKTPEPRPGRRPRKESLSFVIQKHDATRLHYDFRLEWGGVLLSWAVTRGPSPNPADKRLAVRTEDHPVSYGGFEGIIPEGQYGGGTVMLWDEGTWEPKGDPAAGLKKGHLSFTLKGQRLKGGWALIRMRGDGKRENWLLVKEKDSEADGSAGESFLDDLSYSVKTSRSMEDIAGDRKARSSKVVKAPARPRGKKPAAETKISGSLGSLLAAYPGVQLATLVDAPPEGSGWVHEIKFDGYRLLAYLSRGKVTLRTRNGKDWTAKFPAITAAAAELKAQSAVLDLEAVVLDDAGKTSFHALQEALSEEVDTSLITGFVFDLLHLDGKDISAKPLLERKAALQKLLTGSRAGKALQYSDHVTGHGDDMIAKSCALGLEGVISKRAEDAYGAGRRKSWLKSKCLRRQEFIILGYAKARKGGRAIGALYLGYYEGRQLKYAGKVGTGFSMADARDILGRLEKLATDKKPDLEGFPGIEKNRANWTKPSLLCEVAFTEWTGDGHIRHPSYQGLREDKATGGVHREKPEAAVPPAGTGKKAKQAKGAEQGPLILHGVTITHPDRVVFKEGGVTKGDIARYYAAVAPQMLAQIGRHPISLLRCPSGVTGKCFFQRNTGTGLGAEVHPFKWRHKDKPHEYLYVENEKGLMEMIQMGVIEIHPWGAGIDRIDYPDRMIFDLDPDPGLPFAAVKLAAEDLRARLRRAGLESRVKCTGGKGLHIIVPLAGKDSWKEVKEWSSRLAAAMVRDAPEAYIATMTKAKRKGKIFIDFFRNDYGSTAIADYSLRARPGAPAAVPLGWDELKRLKGGNAFGIAETLKRLEKANRPQSKPAKQRLPKSFTF